MTLSNVKTRLPLVAMLLANLSMASHASSAAEYKYFYDERENLRELRVLHILVRDQSSANKIANDLRKLPPDKQLAAFKAKARAISIDEASKPFGGDLGVVQQSSLEEEFDSAIFAATPNEVTPPFKSNSGWHVAYVKDENVKSVATICRASLNKAMEKATPEQQAKLQLSRNNQTPAQAKPAILAQMEGKWRLPSESENGDLNLVGKLPQPTKSGNALVATHTEFPYAHYIPSQGICVRSTQTRYEVDCKNQTAFSQSALNFEGRAAVAQVGIVVTFPGNEKASPTFTKLLLDLACSAD